VQQRLGQGRAVRDDVLAGVEYQQHLPARQKIADRLTCRPIRVFAQPQDLRDRLGYEVGARQRPKFNHPRAARGMRFIVENGGYFKTVKVDYHGGLMYPHLERTATAHDMLTAIARPRQ